jgi:uncharacterized repeat protein (TIGR03803 family)
MTNRGKSQRWHSIKRLTAAAVMLVLAAVLPVLVNVHAAKAQTYTILRNFGLRQGDPLAPTSLILDKSGKLYGTTGAGGNRGDGEGTVFKLNPTTGKLTVLYNFGGGRDGDGPGGLIRDAAGNFYGITSEGGTAFWGTVFKLDKHGAETTLHTFTRGPRDGAQPGTGLVRDVPGNLYGTTPYGGNSACRRGGCGVVFKVSPSGKTVMLHIFAGNPDGAVPMASLIRDRAANLYGTTLEGGNTDKCTSGCGIVFKLGPKGFETVLYRFAGFPDPQYPTGGLTRDPAGNFYGVTGAGGDPTCNCGVVYKLDKSGTLTVLYNFKGGGDGSRPSGNLVRDPAGNLYGATGGGSSGNGTVFKLDTNGVKTILHSFAGFPNDGSGVTGLVRDAAGDLYGITGAGGSNNGGIAFRLTP